MGASDDKRRIGLAVGLSALVVGVAGVELWREFEPDSVEGPAAVTTSPAPSASVPPKLPSADYSNIFKYDYVGPEACRACHAEKYANWEKHPHARMNRNAHANSMRGDFSGVSLDYGQARVVFEQRTGDYVMSVLRNDELVRRFKVTRVVGSRFVQMYIGVQTVGPEPKDDVVYRIEKKLPFAYWLRRKQWFPQTYDEAQKTDEFDESGALLAHFRYDERPGAGTWRRTCTLCHNTFPYATRLEAVGQDRVHGFPVEDVKLDPPREHAALDEERQPVVEDWDLVTFGISCESCHFGGREHVEEGEPISFWPRGAGLTMAQTAPEAPRGSAYVINGICRQCHAATSNGPIYPHGGGTWNSREGLDLAAGNCASEIRCTHCHDPHVAGPVPNAAVDDPKHVSACVSCHEDLADADAAKRHHRHGDEDAPNCLDCHMPRIVHGLDDVIRSHRISSPSEPRMLNEAMPNACNLCHVDASLGWTVAQLKRGWGVDVKVDGLPEGPAGEVWLKHDVPVVHTIAAHAYARTPIGDGELGREALPHIASLLKDDTPANRMFGVLAVERILGRSIDAEAYTPWAPPAERARQVDALLAKPQ